MLFLRGALHKPKENNESTIISFTTTSQVDTPISISQSVAETPHHYPLDHYR